MKREEAMQIIDSSVETLASQLEQGLSDPFRAYLDFMARFHRYSFRNQVLILCQKPEATHVAGFHAWLKLDRCVRRGEHGCAILAPMVRKNKDEQSNETSSDRNSRSIISGFKIAYVFDISQTEGKDLPEATTVQGDAGLLLDQLKSFVQQLEIKLEFESLGMGIQGASAGGTIFLRPGMAPAEEFSVLVHEVSHELLHRGERRTTASKKVKETEAEAVAYVVCRAVGLDVNTAASDYIQLYRGTKATLEESMQFIQATALRILTPLLDL